ncbi:hypothetical protein [Ruegeria sp. HKCCD7318]|uniref:hypothetical protein n=1 Tax=Ruegeria sp. HKCCD7318 TaxID=2683014 RepID=UPI001492CDC6|nr:hypothetical protein [Ruegeria sp. HKCCD7318]
MDNLLKHVDQNLDPSLPLNAPEGWRASLRQAVYDCWTREYSEDADLSVREYNECFDANAELSTRLHDVAWVLVRHEWESYRGTLDPAQRRAAAWHLDQAIEEYKALVAGAERRSVEPQSTSLERLRVIRGYSDEIAADLGADNPSAIVRRQQVRDEINRQLRLDGSGAAVRGKDVFASIVGPLQELTRGAMMTYLNAVEARLDAQALAVLVYGNGDHSGGTGASDLSKYLYCREDGTEAACETGSERSVLSLSELASDAELRELYAFVRDAVLERPNAIGLAERYARMKRALYPNDSTKAAAVHAGAVKLRWFGGEDAKEIPLKDLMRADAVIRPAEEGEPSPMPATLEGACKAWIANGEEDGLRCPFRALAERSLPIGGDTDTFGLQKRETEILSLLTRVRDNTEITALQTLIDDLMAESGALKDANGKVAGSDLALPYLVDDRPLTLSDYAKAVCAENSASVFQANRCTLRFSEEEAAGLLHDRLRRLINGEAPSLRYEDKLAGLFVALEDWDRTQDGDLLQDGVLQLPDAVVDAADLDGGSLVEQICLQGPTFLPALQRAGMRDVWLPTGQRSQFAGGICK